MLKNMAQSAFARVGEKRNIGKPSERAGHKARWVCGALRYDSRLSDRKVGVTH